MNFTSNLKPLRPFINYAHRGASEYAPENTMLSFKLGLAMGANGIETDVQKTKDGILVLFHDDTLNRVTGVDGKVSDFTYEELKTFSVNKNRLADKIVSLKEFLLTFGAKNLNFAIELKAKGVAEDTVKMINELGLKNKVVITSFDYEELLAVKKVAPDFKIGYLTWQIDDDLINKMLADGFYEICPRDDFVTTENVDAWHKLGLNVRAWNIKNEDIMKRVYDAGADGMTVNFPDKLVDYLATKL